MNPLYIELTEQIKKSYEEGITVDEAERLAGKFLYAQMQVAEELRISDLNARMKKSGTKAIKAAVYLAEVGKTEKKPTESQLAAKIDTDPVVMSEQESLDKAEVDKSTLENYLSIFQQAHHHYRNISKGSFNA